MKVLAARATVYVTEKSEIVVTYDPVKRRREVSNREARKLIKAVREWACMRYIEKGREACTSCSRLQCSLSIDFPRDDRLRAAIRAYVRTE